MKKIIVVILAMLTLFSCAKKETAISWEEYKSFGEILKSAEGKYVMIDFLRYGCSWCVRLDNETFKDSKVIDFVNTNMVAVKMHNDSTVGREYAKLFNITGFPTVVFVDSDSSKIHNLYWFSLPATKRMEELTASVTKSIYSNYIDIDGIEIDRIVGYLPPEKFLNELQRIQRGENTIADYIDKTAENPNDFDLWKILAGKYEDRGDLVSALEVWESVAETNVGDQVLVDYKLVELYAHINKDETGLEEFVVNNLDSEFTPIAFRNIINIQRRNKDIIAEVKTWINFVNYMELKQIPTAGFYNSFAWRMSEIDTNLNLAMKKIQTGIDMVAEDDSSTLAGYMDTEAEVLWKMGNADEAVEVIDKCIALQPDDKYFKDQKEKFLEN